MACTAHTLRDARPQRGQHLHVSTRPAAQLAMHLRWKRVPRSQARMAFADWIKWTQPPALRQPTEDPKTAVTITHVRLSENAQVHGNTIWESPMRALRKVRDERVPFRQREAMRLLLLRMKVHHTVPCTGKVCCTSQRHHERLGVIHFLRSRLVPSHNTLQGFLAAHATASVPIAPARPRWLNKPYRLQTLRVA